MLRKILLILTVIILITSTITGFYVFCRNNAQITALKIKINDKASQIKTFNVKPNDAIALPIVIEGEAPGSWFFESSFPIEITSLSDQSVIVKTVAKAKSNWMTNEMVPFSASIPESNYSGGAIIRLKKDNPSGLLKNDKIVEIPITIVLKTPGVTKEILIFFATSGGSDDCVTVSPVKRIIPIGNEAVARFAVDDLLKGPTVQEKSLGYITEINQDVKINKLTLSDGLLKIDFNDALQSKVGGSCRVTLIRSQIENTLKQFSTVRKVVISVNGQSEGILQP